MEPTRAGRSLAVGLLLSLVGPACGSVETPSGSASCAFIAHFEGRTYEGVSVQVAPEIGPYIGTATSPPCNDTNDDVPEEAESFDVARLPGVSPETALALPHTTGEILVREGLEQFPEEIARLLQAPHCDRDDAPIRLYGTWTGILGADGNTELDLEPPYDVSMFVEQASHDRYLRASLTVRVPPALGQPLSHEDIESSLWEGGNIEISATCDDKGYVAEQVEAQPPT